jgi:hypothetical protein
MRKGWLLKAFKILICIPKELLLTLYDDFEFKHISLPRVIFAISAICVVTSWYAEQFHGLKYSNFSSLVTWCISCAGAYAAKKYVERDKPPPPSPYNNEDKEP